MKVDHLPPMAPPPPDSCALLEFASSVLGPTKAKLKTTVPRGFLYSHWPNQVGPEVAFSFRAAGERERPTRQVNAAFTATCRDLIHGPPSPLKTSGYSMLLACRTAWTAGPTNKGSIVGPSNWHFPRRFVGFEFQQLLHEEL
ncbi:hypothetical protein ACE6H2_014721 [Prunus campanulata]